MELIKNYVRSFEYILILVLSLGLAIHYYGQGFLASDVFLMMSANRFYLNLGLVLPFLIYLARKGQGARQGSLLDSWLKGSTKALVLAAFTIVSLSLIISLVGDLVIFLGTEDPISQTSPIVDRLTDHRNLVLVQAFSGLSFAASLTLVFVLVQARPARALGLVLGAFYLVNIIFPDLINFPWILAPVKGMSPYYALDYNDMGPMLVSIFHFVGIGIIGNLLVLARWLAEKADELEEREGIDKHG